MNASLPWGFPGLGLVTQNRSEWLVFFCFVHSNNGRVWTAASPVRVLLSPNRLFVADDGKLFHGSGVGDPFGPRCFEGDVMGCGIMFPRDFTDGDECCIPSLSCCSPGFNFLSALFFSSDETDDWGFEVFTKPSEVQNDLYAGQEEEESEGEDLEGKKVVVRWSQSLRGG